MMDDDIPSGVSVNVIMRMTIQDNSYPSVENTDVSTGVSARRSPTAARRLFKCA